MADADAEFDPEDPTAPVEWETMVAAIGRSELTAVETFEAHRTTVSELDSMAAAVAHCYEALHEEHPRGERPPDQGAPYLFAYLLERAGIHSAEPAGEGVPAVPSLVERRPTADALERLVWDEEVVPWWIAVRLGVHYSLVQFWCYEESIPLMVRNVWNSRHEIADYLDA